MTSAQDVLNQARRWVGFTEGGSNANPFGQWYGYNNVAWCAEFVEYCFAMAGAPLPVRTAAVNGLAGYAQQHGLWRPSSSCQPGDIICFDWTGTCSGRDPGRTHTGLVEARPNGAIQTIEGNTSNPNHGPDGVFRKVWVAGGSLIWGTINCQGMFRGGGVPGQPGNRFANESTVHEGSTGQSVRDLQNALNAVSGRGLVADGRFGPATTQAVRDYQGYMHLGVDGVVGPQTWASLDFLLDQKGR